MKLNVAQLMKAAVGSTRAYTLDEALPEIEGARLTRPVHLSIHLTRLNEGLLARGDVETQLEDTCSRCGEPAHLPVTFHFEEELRPSIDIASGQLLDAPDEGEPVFRIDANHVVNLDELIRQGVVMEQPMHPLCSPACRGLCAACGANLNLNPCSCHGRQSSGTLAAILRDLGPLLSHHGD
ncbi:MAG: YceD family protein [Chloroflexota bacterium]